MKDEMLKVLESVESRVTKLEQAHNQAESKLEDHRHNSSEISVGIGYELYCLKDVISAIIDYLGVEIARQNSLMARKTDAGTSSK